MRLITIVAAALALVCTTAAVGADDPTAKIREKNEQAAAKDRPGWQGQRVEPGTIAADSLSRSQYQAEKARIEADARAARESCKSMSRDERRACSARAKNDARDARETLEARRKQSAGARRDLRAANAMDYEKAKKQCELRSGEAKRTCLKEARDARKDATR